MNDIQLADIQRKKALFLEDYALYRYLPGAVQVAGITIGVFKRWCEEDPDFAHDVEQANAVMPAKATRLFVDAAMGEGRFQGEKPHMGALTKIVSSMNPDFAEKQTHEHEHKVYVSHIPQRKRLGELPVQEIVEADFKALEDGSGEET